MSATLLVQLLARKIPPLPSGPVRVHRLLSAAGDDQDEVRRCKRCATEKPASAFYWRATRGTYTNWCKACELKSKKDRVARRKEGAA